MQVEKTILEIIRGEKKAPLMKGLLAGLAQGYKVGVILRNWAYDHRLLSPTRLSKTVISVGNIAVGGTGKTPCVQLLATALSSRLPVAILSRGFRSKQEYAQKPQLIPLDRPVSAHEYGDEPLLLAQKTKLPVWVGKDRVASGKAAIQAGAECLILDDGMQHRRLHRDVEIVVVDGKDPLAQGHFLPRGLLRESPQRLKKATLIIATHVQSAAHYKRIKKILAPYTSAPVVATQVFVLNPPLSQEKVGVFCGIGTPKRFLQTVRDLNQEIVDTLLCADHTAPSEEELSMFSKKCRCKGAQALLCTEKDKIKLPLSLSLDLPIVPIEIGLKIIEGESHWQQLIEMIVKRGTV